jgi:hypothetical protein
MAHVPRLDGKIVGSEVQRTSVTGSAVFYIGFSR